MKKPWFECYGKVLPFLTLSHGFQEASKGFNHHLIHRVSLQLQTNIPVPSFGWIMIVLLLLKPSTPLYKTQQLIMHIQH